MEVLRKQVAATTAYDIKVKGSEILMSDRLVNIIVHGLIRLMLLLPYDMRIVVFGKFVAYVIAPLAGYLKRAETHVMRIWPDLPARRRKEISRACCDNLGRTMIENYSGEQLQTIAEMANFVGPGMPALEKAKANKRPVIFVSGHFGNFEVPRRALHARGFDIGAIYRKMRNSHFNTHYEQTMIGVSGPVFAQGIKGTLQFARFLRSGGMGTILIDVRQGGRSDIDFLGRPAPTSPAAADFANRFDALLIPYFGRRLADGKHFEVVIGTPIEHGEKSQMMQDATNQLAELVKTYPEQYFWVHRRWRR